MGKLPRFYLHPENLKGSKIILPDAVVRHVFSFRLKPGDEFVLFDGSGVEYRVRLLKEDQRIYVAELVETFAGLPLLSPKIFLYQAPIKKERWEWLLEKSTELGVFAITPLITNFTEMEVEEKYEKKLQRWESIVQSACEQCGRSILPFLGAPIPFKKAILEAPGEKILFFEKGGMPIKNFLNDVQLVEDVSIFVGPEGGFSKEEVDWAISQNVRFVSLGKLILRAETAGVAGTAFLRLWFFREQKDPH
jgi:16S rRNA (uracil1498-N3)-methyltransferase